MGKGQGMGRGRGTRWIWSTFSVRTKWAQVAGAKDQGWRGKRGGVGREKVFEFIFRLILFLN